MSADTVKVAVRVRPFNQREINAGSKCIISMKGNTTVIRNPETNNPRDFSFDHCYWSHDGFKVNENGISEPDGRLSNYADQKIVFDDLGKGVLDNALQGYNSCLFAYGQTGSGKSYSMIGYGQNKGIVPISCDTLFQTIHENKDENRQMQITFSMLEIYNEQVRDLLVNSKGNQKTSGLKVRLHAKEGFYVEGLKQVPVKSYEEMEKWMDQGVVNRTTAATNMNASSSRSHMVISVNFKQVFLNDNTTKQSRINLVDLAGSERANSTGATDDRLKEGSAINLSLTTLGNVIRGLAEMSKGKRDVIVPYRNSVLTKLLKPALGGNSKTIMIAALSPADINYSETLSTLKFADSAKSIQNKAIINESPTDKLIRELKEENLKLMALLEKQKIGSGGKAGEQSEEIAYLLTENERQMAEMKQTWEQRLEEARREWELEQGSIIRSKTESENPFIQNVNEDVQLSGVMKYSFKNGTNIIGKNGSDGVDIGMSGFGIMKHHAKVKNKKGEATIEPISKDCKICINGNEITKVTKLRNMDRLTLGSNTLYLYIGHINERKPNDNPGQYDYDYFQREVAESSKLTGVLSDPSKPHSNLNDTALQMVFQEYIDVLPKVREANYMSDEMGKNVNFELKVKNLTSHDATGKLKRGELVVRVKNTATNQVWIWRKEKFIDRKYLIQDMYWKFKEGEKVNNNKDVDPFWDPIEDIHLGSSHIWLTSLAYCLDSREQLEIQDDQGIEQAVINVGLIPCNKNGKELNDEEMVMDPQELLGKRMDFIISLEECIGIKWIREEESRGIYLKFQFYNYKDYIKSKTVWGASHTKVDFRKMLTIHRITSDFINYLQTQAIVLELYGTQKVIEDGDSGVQDSDGSCASSNYNISKEELLEKCDILQMNMTNMETEIKELRETTNSLKTENTKLKSKIERIHEGRRLRRTSSITGNQEPGSPTHIPPSHGIYGRQFSHTEKEANHHPSLLERRLSNNKILPDKFTFPRKGSQDNAHILNNDIAHKMPLRRRASSIDSDSHERLPPIEDHPTIKSNNVVAKSTNHTLDPELAKSLKDFFKNVRQVQSSVRATTESCSHSGQPEVKKLHHELQTVEKSLTTCVSELKTAVLESVRRTNNK